MWQKKKKKKMANVSSIFPYLDTPNIDSQEDGERHHLNMDCPGLRGDSAVQAGW